MMRSFYAKSSASTAANDQRPKRRRAPTQVPAEPRDTRSQNYSDVLFPGRRRPTPRQPPQEPVPEPEPILELDPVFEPEPVREPEPVQERVPEPKAVQEPEQEQEAMQEPVPEPEAVQEPEPEQEAMQEPVPEQEAVQEPEPEQEAVQEPEQEPKAVQEPVPEPEAVQEPEQEQEAVQEPEPLVIEDPLEYVRPSSRPIAPPPPRQPIIPTIPKDVERSRPGPIGQNKRKEVKRSVGPPPGFGCYVPHGGQAPLHSWFVRSGREPIGPPLRPLPRPPPQPLESSAPSLGSSAPKPLESSAPQLESEPPVFSPFSAPAPLLPSALPMEDLYSPVSSDAEEEEDEINMYTQDGYYDDLSDGSIIEDAFN